MMENGATDVVVIGNGPAGICLSLFLSGWRPYYRGGHPDLDLNVRMSGSRKSLMDRELAPLCEGLSGRSDNPVALLFDALHHPLADTGRARPSCLVMRNDGPQLAHRVVGRTAPGGSWHQMCEGMRSLSPGNWVELPGWSLFEWGRAQGRWIDPDQRIVREEVARYYTDFVRQMGISGRFDSGVAITRVTQVATGWQVSGPTETGEPYRMECQYLVLAGGMFECPNRLNIPGEDLPIVTHRQTTDGKGPLLVVGAGLSAADVIVAAREAGRKVMHAFIDDVEATPMAGLSRVVYPEYVKLAAAMEGAALPGYEALPRTRLTEVRPDGTCRLRNPHGEIERTASQVAVLIGSHADLSFLPDGLLRRTDPIPVNPYTFETAVPRLYAIGPLAGDNFVRFIPGQGFAAARHLLQECTG